MKADHLTATAQGTLDATTLGGEAQVTLALDALAPFAEPYGQPVEGAAELQANLALGAGAELISIDLYGGAHELSGLPEGIGRAARPGPRRWRPTPSSSRTTASRSPTCGSRGAAATLDGKLELALPGQTLDGGADPRSAQPRAALAAAWPRARRPADGAGAAGRRRGQAGDQAGRAEPRPAGRRRAARCADAQPPRSRARLRPRTASSA